MHLQWHDPDKDARLQVITFVDGLLLETDMYSAQPWSQEIETVWH